MSLRITIDMNVTPWREVHGKCYQFRALVESQVYEHSQIVPDEPEERKDAILEGSFIQLNDYGVREALEGVA